MSAWRTTTLAILATLVIGLMMYAAFPVRAQEACTKVQSLAVIMSDHGEVTTYPGGDTVRVYSAAIRRRVPTDIEPAGLFVVDNGGTVVAVGIIEADGCVRYSVAVSRDLHMSAMDKVKGI